MLPSKPSDTATSSKTLNHLAPEYHPISLALGPVLFNAAPFLPTPQIFFFPASQHEQRRALDTRTNCYPAPGNPSPPQAVAASGCSSAVEHAAVKTGAVGDGQPFGQVRERRAARVGGLHGLRASSERGYLGRPDVWRRIERSHASSSYSNPCVLQEENRHKLLSFKQDEENTTVMLKNIPYDCPRKYLIELLDRFCAECRDESSQEQIDAAYDFFYLPIDFKTRKGRGFAFFNFTNSAAAWKFFDAFNATEWDSEKWDKWPKRMEIARAKIQGKEALITHFSNSTFECETDDYLPVYFSPPRDGSGQHVKTTSVGKRRAALHWELRGNHRA